MELEGSLPHSQVSATCPYHEPATVSLVHNPTSHFLRIYHIIFFPSSLSPQWFPIKTLYKPLPYPIRATCPAHLILLDFITRRIVGVEYRPWNSWLWSFLHSPVNWSLLGPKILPNTIFSNTLSLRSSLNVSDPYKTTGKIIVLCTLIFKFFG
jgi:hypothetical protein